VTLAGADGTGTLLDLACGTGLAGFVLSTSVLSRVGLGGRTADFARDLRRELHASAPGGRFRQTLSFGYDLARRPGPTHT
jgi:hypothetical protein